MVEHNRPLKNRLRSDQIHVTRGELVEWLTEFGGSYDDAVWIDNYWQIRHQIIRRPIERLSLGADAFHIGEMTAAARASSVARDRRLPRQHSR